MTDPKDEAVELENEPTQEELPLEEKSTETETQSEEKSDDGHPTQKGVLKGAEAEKVREAEAKEPESHPATEATPVAETEADKSE